MSVAAKIFDQPLQREERLKRMDLDEALVVRSLDLAFLDRKTCTDFDPPYFAGVTRSARTVRYLRESFVPRGWGYSDARNYSLLLHPTDAIAIAVATGNECTGDASLPGLRLAHGKGEMTSNAVTINENQLSLFDGFTEGGPASGIVVDGIENRFTWMLLLNEREGRLHAELSLPRTFVDKNVTAWDERIILPSRPLDDDAPHIGSPDLGSEPLDVTNLVQRRNS